ncbi:MAG TPA: FtsX-like permease family protein [Candidatus Acidoferrales bacterium]|nr:FtsX-like permease family protein [Candidatus Acidoferrales bacterium]
MFKRLLWHLLRGNRVRMAVALLALTSGGAVVSALLNLNVDVNRKLSQEFRSLGANLVISSQTTAAASGTSPALIDASAIQTIERAQSAGVVAAPYLYVVAQAASAGNRDVVVAGTWLDRIARMSPSWQISGDSSLPRADGVHCLIGRNVSRTFGVITGGKITLANEGHVANLTVSGVIDAGGSEDNQIFVNLPVAQKLAGAEGKIQLIELSVPGSPEGIRALESRLQSALPALAVKPIPQITEAEGKLLGRIRFLIVSTGLLILVLTALCILATMAALAMERRKDVGLMKALGGSMQKVLRIFLAEVGILGVTGGILGYVLGMFLSIWMGHRVFGASITPRWEVFPATVALMLIVSLAGALPLRLLGNIRPAVILRGE